MRALLLPYPGKCSGQAGVQAMFRNFPSMLVKAEDIILARLGLPPLPDDVMVRFNLSDAPSYGCMPMCTPTGSAWSLKSNPFMCDIELSACAVGLDFLGYTTAQKVITHELVHIQFKVRGGPAYDANEDWLKEGVALWTAGQTYTRDFMWVPVRERNERWVRYRTYFDKFSVARNRVGLEALLRQLLGQSTTHL